MFEYKPPTQNSKFQSFSHQSNAFACGWFSGFRSSVTLERKVPLRGPISHITNLNMPLRGSELVNTMTSMRRCAYVTYLTANDTDVQGAVALAKGLRKAKSKYPLAVAILPEVLNKHRRILLDQGCILRDIEPLYPPENSTQFAEADFVRNYSKLRIFKFEEYSKAIYLDKHTQVFENIDHLFDMPDGYFYGVTDCFCGKTWSHTPQFKIGYCQQCPDKVEWPVEFGPKPARYFHAGMFVYEPSMSTYQDLLNTLNVNPPTSFAVQQNLEDFLNVFFKNIYKPISPIYNLALAMLWSHPENIELDKARVVHYCAAPWRYTGNEQNMEREDIKMLVQKWWDIYNDESLDYKNCSSPAAAVETEAEVEVVAEADEDVILQPSREEGFWEAADCCSIKDLCLQPFLSAVSEASCFSPEDLSLQPFLEALWEVGCGVIEDLTSLTELCVGGYRCGGFFFWF